MRLFPRLSVVLPAMALLASTTSAPTVELPSAKEKWLRVETANFTLFSNASKRRTLEISRSLERFRQVLSLFYDKLSASSPVPSFVYLFKHDAAFTPFKIRHAGKVMKVSGYFVGWRTANYIAMNANPQIDPLDVIYHEYIHHLLNQSLPTVPAWFSEGLAECYSTFQADKKKAQIGKPVMRHLETLRGHSLIPLSELLAVTHGSDDYHGERSGIFYAESWALVHYLLWGKPERRPQLVEFLDQVGQGENADEAFSKGFDTTPEELENELRYYIEQGRFHYSIGKYESLNLDIGQDIAPMRRADVLYRLGDLLAHLNDDRGPEAKDYFREALRVNPSHAGAYAGLGWIRGREGRLNEAVTLYEKAVAADPDDFLINYHFGKTLLRRSAAWPADEDTAAGTEETGDSGIDSRGADLERAKELFRRSIENRSGFGEAYVGYGLAVKDSGGDLGSAIALLEAGWHLLPARTDIVVNLAILYDRKGEGEKARLLVDEVLPRMGDPEALKRARLAVASTEEQRPTGEPDPTQERRAPSGVKPPPNLPDDPEVRRVFEESIQKQRQLNGEYDRQAEIYNQAVNRANGGDLMGAIALLEELLLEIKHPELSEETRSLLEQMKKDLDRLKRGRS